MNETMTLRIYQIGAVAMLLLALSLVWRTGLQPMLVVPTTFDKVTKYKLCEKADGCVFFWETEVRYNRQLNAWVPVIRPAYGKTGHYNARDIRNKIMDAINAEADNGFFLLREARKNAEIRFEIDRTK